MYKEKLENIITEMLINDLIDGDKFLKLSEDVDIITEEKAEEILYEFDPVLSPVIIGSVAVIITQILRKKKTGYFKCKHLAKYKGLSANEGKKVIYKCQIGVIDKAISDLRSSTSKCKNSKNPEKCKNGILHTISMYEEEKTRLKIKLKKL